MGAEREFSTLYPEGLAPGRLLRSLDLAARKGLGQNFLAGKSALRQVLLALDPQPDDVVVEIGAGLGTLTGYLAAEAGRVLAVELDDHLAGHLEGQFAGAGNVQVVRGDILALHPSDLGLASGSRYKAVGNLPYYITSAALRHVLGWVPTPEVLVVMVQEEVARRIVARPGDLSLLALMVQLAGAAELVARVPAGAFVPPPKVNSAVVRIVPHSQPRVTPAEEDQLFRLARAAFQQKRKTLANSLAGAVPLSKSSLGRLLESVGLSPSTRAQQVSLEQWIALTAATQEVGDARS